MSEKTCVNCSQPIKKGEGYTETDYGSGKFYHWPNCPPSSPEKLSGREIDQERAVQPETSPLGEIRIVDGLTLKDYYDLRDLRLLLMGLEKELIGKYGIIEAEPFASKVRELIKKKLEQITSKIDSTPEHHSSPEHHVTREEAEAEVNVLIDNLAAAIRKGGDITSDLRQALLKGFMFFKSNPGFPPQYTDFENWLKKQMSMTIEEFKAIPQDRKDFIYGLFKGIWGNPHLKASTANPDEKLERCVICGYEGTKEPDQHGNYIFYWQDEPICMVCREDHSLELDAGIKPSHIKGEQGKSE